MTEKLDALFEFVTQHNVIVVVLLLILTAGVGAGIPQINLQSTGGSGDIGAETETVQQANYLQDAYINETRETSNTTTAVVYFKPDDGNALSKESLIASLEYQQRVTANASVAATSERGPFGVANLIGARAAGSPDATLSEQLRALRAASPSEVRQLVRETLTADSQALSLLPTDYEPGTAQAESHRMVFQLSGEDAATEDATRALYETASDDEALFTLGPHAQAAQPANAGIMNLLWLVVPFSLTAIFVVLAFVYRDLVDVIVGFLGIVASLVWMFGLLGWLQIPAGLSVIIAPVLIIGLSVDYGLHVFMRYREERGADEELRAPMARSTARLASALAMVTLTAVVGFAANATSPLATIEQLGYGISLGVISTFVVSVTLVPASKVTADSLLERLGLDRRKAPLGKSRLLEPVLSGGATLAVRAAPVVLVIGLVLGGAGAAAWADLDRQAFVNGDSEVADWKKELPEPIGWTTTDYREQFHYVNGAYRAAESADRERSSLLVESRGGGAASAAVLDRVAAIQEAADDQETTLKRGDSVRVQSPLTVMQAVAAEDESFAAVFDRADTDGDGVPDRNVKQVYDALYATAPDQASRVIDRTDDGYQSVRVVLPIDPAAGSQTQGEEMQALASAVETADTQVVAVGDGTLTVVRVGIIADSIVETMLLALAGVAALLMIVYRLTFGSVSLGFVTALPIALVTALVIGGMWVLGVPLTVNTALLLSLVIGLGIDYNIHVSDRAAQELERGAPLPEALTTATTGTGGALLGSTLTTVAAFSALLIAPFPFFQNFGKLVAIALAGSFVVAVYILPSLIAVWHRYSPGTDAVSDTQPLPADD